ncbi:hypothetical protein EH228_16335 [Erwinia endophytica]|uniref:beta-ketoacyl synthase N-terminal-like domain-containing protein n=1 Tax=Erwinia endophytica TaxID=1563158 RepID=UPI0012660687|nr:hypothetical protein EH228_16335 [Erwinia endophytica]
MQTKKVVITGLGVIAPNGTGIEKFWSNPLQGISGIKSYEWGKRFGFKSASIGQVDDFSPFLSDKFRVVAVTCNLRWRRPTCPQCQDSCHPLLK